MHFEIASLSEKGKRDRNEDSIYAGKNVFVVCDGVGGERNGQKASKAVVKMVSQLFDSGRQQVNSSSKITELVKFIQHELAENSKQEPNNLNMSTTLAGIYLDTDSISCFHIGDSRVYHFRQNQNDLWRTLDHSIVQSLLENKEITEDQLHIHPLRSQITKALVANTTNKIAEPEIAVIQNYSKGDLILICSDGVYESFNDLELIRLFKENPSVENIKLLLKEKCITNSSDNYSAIILKMHENAVGNRKTTHNLLYRTEKDLTKIFEPSKLDSQTAKKSILLILLNIILITIILTFVFCLLWYFLF